MLLIIENSNVKQELIVSYPNEKIFNTSFNIIVNICVTADLNNKYISN